MSTIAKILNLGHDYSDPDFEEWEMRTKYPLKKFKRVLAQNNKDLLGDGGTMLVLGCGASPMINMFNCDTTGVDISEEKIEHVSKTTKAKVYQADITKMEPIGEFDKVLLTEVIEHVGYSNVDKVLSLVSKSLKIGGRAVISTPDMDNIIGYIVEKILHKEIHCSLLFGKDLVERCKLYGLQLVNSKKWIWDTNYLFEKVSNESLV